MRLAELKHTEIARLPRNTPVILPIAAMEQHGPHLPLQTDTLLCEEIARRVEAQLADRVLIAPMMWLGSSHHHLEFQGTLSVEPRTYLNLLVELVETVLHHGFTKVMFLNGHGGNVVPCQQALFEIKQRHRTQPDLLMLAAPYWGVGTEPRAINPRIKQTSMGHACEWETSMMLRLAPHLVGDYKNAPPVALDDDAFAPAARAWITRERSEQGHVGDPREADPDKGEWLLRIFTQEVTSFTERVIAWEGRSWSR